jgi:hypothetical protein
MQRRSFLVTAATAATASGWQGANDKVRVAIAGMGGRGNDILTETFAIDTLEVGAMVDPTAGAPSPPPPSFSLSRASAPGSTPTRGARSTTKRSMRLWFRPAITGTL